MATPLSPRQADHLGLAGEGLTMKETARRLGISPNTVHWHRQIASWRLGVRNKTEAVVALWRRDRAA